MIKQKQVEKTSNSPWNELPRPAVEDSRIISFVPKLYDVLCSNDISWGKWWVVSTSTEALLSKCLWKSSVTFGIPDFSLVMSAAVCIPLFLLFSSWCRSSWHFGHSLLKMYSVLNLFFFDSGFHSKLKFCMIWYIQLLVLTPIYVHGCMELWTVIKRETRETQVQILCLHCFGLGRTHLRACASVSHSIKFS